MIGLKKEVKVVEKAQFEIYRTFEIISPSLIIGWQTKDIGKIASRVIDFLIEKIEAKEMAEIKPLGFFSFGGARFKDDLIQVPESKFWVCEKNNLLILKSDEPEFEHYKFLNTIFDFAESYGGVKEIYTISGTISFIAHTHPRRILTVFNNNEIKERLQGYELEEMTWEGPPAISSYLLWIAKRKGISGVSLWPEIPFYLSLREDFKAISRTLSFLNKKFNLEIDLEEFDIRAKAQNEKLSWLRKENPDIDKYISRLETGQRLEEEEQLKLIREVYDLFEN